MPFRIAYVFVNLFSWVGRANCDVDSYSRAESMSGVGIGLPKWANNLLTKCILWTIKTELLTTTAAALKEEEEDITCGRLDCDSTIWKQTLVIIPWRPEM